MNQDKPGRWLLLWAVLIIVLNGLTWLSGHRGLGLTSAIERGTARTEAVRVGEVGDDVIRKAIHAQQDTLPFWATLAALGDFVIEPLVMAVRALLVATLFASSAALVGRPIRFLMGLDDCARVQGLWVLGLAVRVGLMLALGRSEVETSATLFLPPGAYPASQWVAMRQLDAFVLLGWTMLALGGWRRGQVNLFTAFTICGLLWMSESLVRIGYALFLGAGMRLTLMPG